MASNVHVTFCNWSFSMMRLTSSPGSAYCVVGLTCLRKGWSAEGRSVSKFYLSLLVKSIKTTKTNVKRRSSHEPKLIICCFYCVRLM